MILLYLVAAALAALAYICAARFRGRTRVLIALLVFLIPSVGVTALVVMVGDRASPDAVTVHLN